MTNVAIAMVTFFLGVGLGGPDAARAGLWEKATGDVVVTNVNYPLRRHWFSFAAHETGGDTSGKGFLAHQRLNADGTEVLRTEYCVIRYVLVDGNDAWFAGPIVYDSLGPNPTRWFALHVYDGGKPRADNDRLWFTRVETESDALTIVETMADPGSFNEVKHGNLKVHAR